MIEIYPDATKVEKSNATRFIAFSIATGIPTYCADAILYLTEGRIFSRIPLEGQQHGNIVQGYYDAYSKLVNKC